MTRVLIVDDHALFADAIRVSLENAGADVVGVAANGQDAIALARSERPDVVLMDVGLPDQSGLAAGREILEQAPGIRVLVLTALESSRASEEAIEAGFHGYLTKDVPVADFLDSVNAVAKGNVVVTEPLPRAKVGGGSGGGQLLTDREHEVLSLLVQGFSSQSIARRLLISSNTVRTHVQSILTKLQVHSRLEAVTVAVRDGLVSASLLDRRLDASEGG